MLYLLNPRLWLIACILAALAVSHIYVYRKGASNVRIEWKASIAAANSEAQRLERARQSRANDAASLASARANGLRADAARAGDALGRLRNAIASRQLAEESAASAAQRAATAEQLLLESATAYRELAETADRHVNDLRQHREAWPQ